jgi:hypothetical protein
MMVEDEFGGRKMNDLRTIVWLNLIDSVGAPSLFNVTADDIRFRFASKAI